MRESGMIEYVLLWGNWSSQWRRMGFRLLGMMCLLITMSLWRNSMRKGL